MNASRIVLWLLFPFIIGVGCTSNDQRLIGTWKSNRELTMKAMPESLPSGKSPEKRKQLEMLFGHLEHTFDGRRATFRMPEHDGLAPSTHSVSYKVIHSDDASVVIQYRDPYERRMKKQRYTFVSPDRYWIPIAESDWPEYFDRMQE